MQTINETSLSAYIILEEALKDLELNEFKKIGKQNGNYNKIIKKCNDIIQKKYKGSEKQQTLKQHIENIFKNLNN